MYEPDVFRLRILDIGHESAYLGHLVYGNIEVYVPAGLKIIKQFLPLIKVIRHAGGPHGFMPANLCTAAREIQELLQYGHRHALHIFPKEKHFVLHIAGNNLPVS